MSENDIVSDFLVESYENLDRLDRELVALEKNPQDRDALASVFRTIHTIKGTCGFLGFSKLEKVAHVGENLLSLLRDGKLNLDPENTTALLQMVDAIRQMLSEIQSTGQDGAEDYADLMATLTRLQNPASNGAPHPATSKVEAAPLVPANAEPAAQETERATIPETDTAVVTRVNEASRHWPAPDKIGGVLVERGLV